MSIPQNALAYAINLTIGIKQNQATTENNTVLLTKLNAMGIVFVSPHLCAF